MVFALAALLFLVFWLLYNEKRGLARPAGDAAPSDPEELAEAISDYAKHMPKNPRDVVRLINLIRVSHAVQSAAGSRKGAEDEQENEDIFPGEAFSASESTCLALWYYKYAHLIDPEKIETMLESNGAEGLIAKLLDKSSDEKWASNLLKVSESNDDLIKALKNPDQTRRFLEIYRNLLRGA